MKTTLTLLAALLLAPLTALHAADFVIVAKDTPPAPIILPKDPTMFTKIAAADLADYIGKVGGVKPEIFEGVPNPMPDRAIWVGFQPKLKELFPAMDFNFQQPEEILIATDGRHLVLAGRDRWSPESMDLPERAFEFGNRDVTGFQFEYGTVNAVYTFLQDHLGVRWLWPGEDGEVVPEKATLAIEPFEFRYAPKVRQRHSLFFHLALHRQGGEPGQPGSDWARRQRVQLDSLDAPASGHGFGDWWERFGKTHPEYFALQPDGSRGQANLPKNVNPRTTKICVSNPAVWEQWLRDVETAVKEFPHRTIFNAAANDGYVTGHCLCEKCRAWDSPDAEKRLLHYECTGEFKKLPALSDREVTHANMLARGLKQRFPGKDYKVLIHAYGYTRPAPVKAVPDDNVIISNVAAVFFNPDAIDPSSLVGGRAMDYFDAWSKISKHHIWRPNAGKDAQWQTGGPPDILAAGANFQKMMQKGIVGVAVDMVWPSWATQGPQYYLMGQLAWNPDRPIQQIMDDYYRTGFGPAADDVQAYFQMLEDARHAMVKDGKTWAQVFSPEFFQRAEKRLDHAAHSASAPNNGSAGRVDFVRAGLEYLRCNTENQALARQIIDSPAPLPDAVEAMRTNWERIKAISGQYPEALHQTSIFQNAASNRYAFIHPDADHKAVEEARMRKEAVRERLNKRVGDAAAAGGFDKD